MTRRTLDQLLADARARIERLEPGQAWEAARAGARIIDVRSERDRERGVVPGSLHIPRTVLEWRLDPDSRWRTPHVGGLDDHLLIMCADGCSSSLAAATLTELGFTRVGDVVGGFSAWHDAGLPTIEADPERDPGVLPGMGPPEPC